MNQQPIKPEDREAAYAFLNRYMLLCRESGFAINSCGCCDSPFIVKVLDEDKSTQDIAPCPLEQHFAHLNQSIGKNAP